MKSNNIKNKLKHHPIIVTAGGTIEPIDPVRYIGNFSSGKMGIAIANEFCKFTSNVTLIHGHITVSVPKNIQAISTRTVEQMYRAIQKNLTPQSILVMAAAVSDFKVAQIKNQKIKKSKSINVKLVPTIDILKTLSRQKKTKNFFVGFAAETNKLIIHSQKKLKDKKLDIIVANPITKKNYPFGADVNKVYFITSQQIIELPLKKKTVIAKELVQFIAQLIE